MRYLNTSLWRNTRPRSKHPQSFNETLSSTQKGVLKHSLFTVRVRSRLVLLNVKINFAYHTFYWFD